MKIIDGKIIINKNIFQTWVKSKRMRRGKVCENFVLGFNELWRCRNKKEKLKQSWTI